jgi:hypothetical protein
MWFKEHVYLASWISPIIGVIAIVLKFRKPDVDGKPTNGRGF